MPQAMRYSPGTGKWLCATSAAIV